MPGCADHQGATPGLGTGELSEIGGVFHEQPSPLQASHMGMEGIRPLVIHTDTAFTAVNTDVVGDDTADAKTLLVL